jgi:hypothetical protein
LGLLRRIPLGSAKQKVCVRLCGSVANTFYQR